MAKLAWNMKAKIINIEAIFLHGNLHGEVYMDVLPGLKVNSSQKLVLWKTINSLVQIAREFYKKLIEVLKHID
jgi:hypothetical protein